MTERERLAELIAECITIRECSFAEDKRPTCEELADYLIAHGVIAPPCKVGSAVWVVPEHENVAILTTVEWILDDGDDITISTGYYQFNPDDLGRNVFMTREEAEAALAERRKA